MRWILPEVRKGEKMSTHMAVYIGPMIIAPIVKGMDWGKGVGDEDRVRLRALGGTVTPSDMHHVIVPNGGDVGILLDHGGNSEGIFAPSEQEKADEMRDFFDDYEREIKALSLACGGGNAVTIAWGAAAYWD